MLRHFLALAVAWIHLLARKRGLALRWGSLRVRSAAALVMFISLRRHQVYWEIVWHILVGATALAWNKRRGGHILPEQASGISSGGVLAYPHVAHLTIGVCPSLAATKFRCRSPHNLGVPPCVVIHAGYPAVRARVLDLLVPILCSGVRIKVRISPNEVFAANLSVVFATRIGGSVMKPSSAKACA